MYYIKRKHLISGAIFTLLSLMGCQNSSLQLLSPKDGIRISNNMPVLAWQKTDCDTYEIWVNQIKMATLPSSIHSYTTFPLSFGEHQWHVRAICGTDTLKSVTGHFTIDDRTLTELPDSAQLLRYNWHVASSAVVGKEGQKISSPVTDTQAWAETSLPATVLTALVRNGIYPNPYVGMNNMLIPDMNDEYNADYQLLKYSHIPHVNPWKDPYWYRTEFKCSTQLNGTRTWLNLGEINYKAEIWLNGKQVADTTHVVGMERFFHLDVTPFLNKENTNILAIAIYPPDYPGKPAPDPITPLGDPGCNMGDGIISKNYTKWDTMGWDWQPPVRDRDMGITEDVFLTTTGSIEWDNLYVSSDLQLPDTLSADLTFSADLVNHTDTKQEGNIEVTISDGTQSFSFNQPYQLEASTTKSFCWNKENIRELRIANPKLWWPFDYGTPHLYTVQLAAKTSTGEQIQTGETFGIRKVETYIGPDERIYKINGRRIYPKGGNWVIDMMLNWTASRYEKEILLTRNANLNIVRVWGPTGIAPKPFYRAADKYGVLIWQDFLNDFWGTFKNTPGYQPEIALYEQITTGVVKKYRNHPSLIIWCGGNEGVNPREDLILNKILPQHDGRDSRHYLKRSDGDGLHGGGPYHTLEPHDYFVHPKLHGFSSEIGPSGVPVIESMYKFMPQMGSNWKPGQFPLDGAWAYHDANDWPGDDTRKFSSYDTMLRDYYGAPDTLECINGVQDYLQKAQIINYDVYRASIESINRLLWHKGSGILLWKSNSSWPSITWQVYDWYLQAHAGYYGTRKAASTIHVQWNRDNHSISIVNLTNRVLLDAQLIMSSYDLNGRSTAEDSETLFVGTDTVISSRMTVKVPQTAEFMKLQLKDATGNLLADNFYWISANNDFKSFQTLPQPELEVSAQRTEAPAGKRKYTVTVTNTGDTLAYMLSLKVVGKNSRTELLPSFWNDNYIALLPNEKRVLNVELFEEDILEEPTLEYATFSSEPQWITIENDINQ